jgi:membrane protease YdiL (CAAX protease family)
VRWRRVITYYALVYAVSYGLVGGFLLLGGSFKDPSWVFFAQVSSLTPALMALGLTRWLWRAPLSSSLGLRLRADRWLLLAWLLPWALALLALGFGLAVPGTMYDGTLQPAVDRTIVSQTQLNWLRQVAARASLPPITLLVPFGLVSSVTMSFVAGCGEEIGWRGFVHTELRALGFWRNALITGLLWLGWHLPLLALGYGYPQHPGFGIVPCKSVRAERGRSPAGRGPQTNDQRGSRSTHSTRLHLTIHECTARVPRISSIFSRLGGLARCASKPAASAWRWSSGCA